MKRIYLALISIVIAFPLLAQTHNDYIEDGVTGGVDRAFNGILWMIIIAVVAVILLFVIGGIQKFIWWYDPSTSPEYKEKQKKRLEESRKPINKPTPKPQVEAPKIQPTEPIKKDIELEIVAKEVWVNVNSENRVNKEVVYSYIDSINFEGKDILDDIGDTILKSPAFFSYKGISIDTRDLPEEAFIPDLEGTQIDKVLISISGDFTPSKLHLIAVEDIDTNWLFHTGYVIYDGELIRLHLQ